MSIENERTLDFYNKHADLYCLRGKKFYAEPDGIKDNEANQNFLRQSLEGLPKDAKMFEIGSGDGRDAHFVNSLGYDIQTSDAVESFLSILRENGFLPIKFNIIKDAFAESYDYILANAVFVHFTKPEVRIACEKVYGALNGGGRFIVAFKRRLEEESGWKTGVPGTTERRFFSYWDADEVKTVLENVGFKIVYFWEHNSAWDCWLNFVALR